MTFESLAALIIIVLALFGGGAVILAPLVTRVGAIDKRIEALGLGGKDLTDYQKKTIEQITRLEERASAIVSELSSTKLLRDQQFTDVNLKIDREIHGQGDTRVKAFEALQLAMEKLDGRFVAISNDIRDLLERVVWLEKDGAHPKPPPRQDAS